MQTDTPCAIEPLVPHRGAMCLLDTLLHYDADGARAEVVPDATDLFMEAGVIPAWVGLEWLAQAVAAWAGMGARLTGAPPPPGFLIASRRYRARVDAFALGEPVHVHVTRDFVADNGVRAFSGTLTTPAGEPLAEGQLSIFQPDTASLSPAPSTSRET
ncbi:MULTISPECIES: ApeP family dehydratase [Chromohalobacter]|uniref:Hotdog family 3-hydroxylacyl-ACP dehydratase n=1 Tax=Chromohalobacter israelensis (strain ATCC BAA-138 / DSM 3043 / CIP 106854 / NCIMB 13768 / 1H11) TaxID=290398 RepID=Q1QTV2_CHRI1|nr:MULTISPECIES: hotdog family protein [Chromohalobacter]ABE60106.1 conserved hypothetical protein [Chromohalobacter salexigens DSM 3043]MDO0945969.1 hotdog family protein [Chromohalobacter salexigens]NQY45073.1 hotdog family protein [Chromohalobacter sp.]RXE49105.1 hypothetical protein B4O83_14460 [Chromohalobacter salexigens]